MVDCTDSLYVVANHIYVLLNEAKDNFVTRKVLDVFYGEQTQIPRTPAITVQAGTKNRELAGAPRRTENRFEVLVKVFFSDVRGITMNHAEADQLAEEVEAKIHEDVTFGGLVINSLVAMNESGYLNKENTQFRGSQLVVQAMTKTSLPMSPTYNQP